MEEDSEGEDSTPFWLQSNTNLRRADRLRHRFSSVFLSSGLVVFLLLVLAVFFLGFVVPSTLSFSSQIFKPNSVKKSWDSLNVFLVLVAVVFGFLSKNKSEDTYSSPSSPYYGENVIKQNEAKKSNPSTPNTWYRHNTIDEQRSNVSAPNQWDIYSDYQTREIEYINPILRRNSSSYPDLRESSPAHWTYGDFHRRFHDDMNVDSGRTSDPIRLHRRHRSLEEIDHLRPLGQAKPVIVDTLVSHSTKDERSQVSSIPQPEIQEKPKNSHENIGRKKERYRRKMEKDLESINSDSVPMTSPHVPPPSPPPQQQQQQQKRSKNDRKRGGSLGSSSATKDFLNSLYNKRKKKQRQKSVDNLDLLLYQSEAPLRFQLPPPSLPPPPSKSPPSVFQNLFSSKKHKRKRTIIVRVKSPPPPPAPPQPNAALEQNPNSQIATVTTHKLPVKMDSFEKSEVISNSGGESPIHRVPPPPPPPPPSFFKKPTWKFVVQGDYVRMDSNNSSRSGSPDLDEVDSDVTPFAADAGDATAQPLNPTPLFCPSPDVNAKADSFITNFRAKLKLEKIQSIKKRELGFSSLGPGPGAGRRQI